MKKGTERFDKMCEVLWSKPAESVASIAHIEAEAVSPPQPSEQSNELPFEDNIISSITNTPELPNSEIPVASTSCTEPVSHQTSIQSKGAESVPDDVDDDYQRDAIENLINQYECESYSDYMLDEVRTSQRQIVTTSDVPDNTETPAPIDPLTQDRVVDTVAHAESVKRTSPITIKKIKKVTYRRGSKIVSSNPDWLWKDWLCRGGLNLLGGEPGVNKTTVAMEIAAIVSSGGIWPDGSKCERAQEVFIWSTEDSIEKVLTPRLIAAGANMDNICFPEYLEGDDDDLQDFDLSKHAENFRHTLQQDRNDIGLLIIDSTADIINGDSHKNLDVRKSLRPIIKISEEFEFAILGIVHFNKENKKSAQNPLDRIIGSMGFGGVARVVLASALDPNNTPNGRLLVRVKSNYGSNGDGFEYEIQDDSLPSDPKINAIHINWGEFLEGVAAKILSPPVSVDDDPTHANKIEKLDRAKKFIIDTLANGPIKSDEMKRLVDEQRLLNKHGFSPATVKRAKKEAGFVSDYIDGKMMWVKVKNG